MNFRQGGQSSRLYEVLVVLCAGEEEMDLRIALRWVLWIVLLSTCLCTSGKIIFTFNILTFTFCRAMKTKGMVFRYTWVYSEEDTMAHTRRPVVTS